MWYRFQNFPTSFYSFLKKGKIGEKGGKEQKSDNLWISNFFFLKQLLSNLMFCILTTPFKTVANSKLWPFPLVAFKSILYIDNVWKIAYNIKKS